MGVYVNKQEYSFLMLPLSFVQQSEDNSMESSQFAVEEEHPLSANNDSEESQHAESTARPEATESGLMEEDDGKPVGMPSLHPFPSKKQVAYTFVSEDLAGLLSPAELRLLGRMRQVTEAPFEVSNGNYYWRWFDRLNWMLNVHHIPEFNRRLERTPYVVRTLESLKKLCVVTTLRPIRLYAYVVL